MGGAGWTPTTGEFRAFPSAVSTDIHQYGSKGELLLALAVAAMCAILLHSVRRPAEVFLGPGKSSVEGFSGDLKPDSRERSGRAARLR